MEGDALVKWESTLNLGFMPTETMLILSYKLLLSYNHSLYDLILYLWSCPLQSWFRPCCSTLISFSDKLKCLSSTDQYTSLTSILIYLWVLSLLSWWISRSYITSYELLINYDISLIPVSLVFWVVGHSGTLISELSTHCDSTTLSNLLWLWVVLDHVIPRC